MRNIFYLLYLKLSLSFVILFSLSATSQEKKIIKALNALEKGKYTECNNLILEFQNENKNSPLSSFAEYKLYANINSPFFNLQESYNKLLLVSNWLSVNKPDEKWCEKFELCANLIPLQMDSIALMALKFVEKDKSDDAYISYINFFKNSNVVQIAWNSFYDWKYKIAFDSNNKNNLESFILLYPNAYNVDKARLRLEELEYQTCVLNNDSVEHKKFLKKYPNSLKYNDIKESLIKIEYENCKNSDDIFIIEKFLTEYPNSKFNEEINKKLEFLYFGIAMKSSSAEQLQFFLTKYPNSNFKSDIVNEIKDLKNCIELTTIGIGNTREISVQNALKSAMGRVFGSFISSNEKLLLGTSLANELISTSSGNIKSFQLLNEIKLINGDTASIVKVVISRDNLQRFVISKGIEVEYKGLDFVDKIKQQQMNEQAEYDALYSIFSVIFEKMQIAFDYKVRTSDPISINDGAQKWAVNVNVEVVANDIMDECFNTLISGLEGITMSDEELTSYIKINKPVYFLNFDISEKLKREGKWVPHWEEWNGRQYFTERKLKQFYFRKKESFNIIESFIGQFDFYLRNFEVENNLFINESKGNSINKIELIIDDNIRTGGYGGLSYDFQSFISLPSGKDTVTNFLYQDFFTLEELSKIEYYKVKSLGVSVKIKHGGYVIFEENGSGLVLSISDYPILTKNFFLKNDDDNERSEFSKQYNNFLNSISNISMGGFKGWKLPTENEFRLVYENIVNKHVPECGLGLENNQKNDYYDEDENFNKTRDLNSKTKSVCYDTPILYKNDFGGMLTYANHSWSPKLLRQGVGHLKSTYLTSSFYCNNSILLNYDSTVNQWFNCSELSGIYFNTSFPDVFKGNSHRDFAEEIYSKPEISLRFVRSFNDSLNNHNLKKIDDQSVKIGYQTWMKKNLNVDKFKNGDIIKQAHNFDEWNEANENKQPIWCYKNFNSSLSSEDGKLYNWYAITDSRCLAPIGWRIPSSFDFRMLAFEVGMKHKEFKSISGWDENGNNKSGLNIFPSDCFYFHSSENNHFSSDLKSANWWTRENTLINPESNSVNFEENGAFNFIEVKYSYDFKQNGYSVRCVKE